MHAVYRPFSDCCYSGGPLQVAGLAGIPRTVRARAGEAAAGLERKIGGSFAAASAAGSAPAAVHGSVHGGGRPREGSGVPGAAVIRGLCAALAGGGNRVPEDAAAVRQLWRQSHSILAGH